MSYELLIERAARKALEKIPQPHRDRIITAVFELASEPRPQGSRQLTGREAWRIRIGSYRVIYEIHDDKLIILVVAVGHRSSVYR